MTSHPVSPPWNSGDKHLARELLLHDSGVDHVFMTDREDVTEWPPRSQPQKHGT